MSTFIFSVYQSNESERFNLLNHIETVDELTHNGHEIIETNGKYKGQSELSILIKGDVENLVSEHCKLNNQESYLRIDQNNNAELIFVKTPKTIQLGIFTEVSQNEANESDASTEINGKFFVCKG